MKFSRHAAHRKKRLKTNWRRPRGLHNKMRLEKKSAKPRVKEGYRTKKETRGLKNGLEIIRVHNVSDVKAVDVKTQGVVIANIGMKKKLAVLEEIKSQKITLLTGDPQKEIDRLTEKFQQRVKQRDQIKQEKQEKQEELEKLSEESKDESTHTPLKKVKGVGPATIGKLEDAGITSAEQLAEMTEQELSEQVEGVSAQKIIDAAKKVAEGQDEKEKVLTKAR